MFNSLSINILNPSGHALAVLSEFQLLSLTALNTTFRLKRPTSARMYTSTPAFDRFSDKCLKTNGESRVNLIKIHISLIYENFEILNLQFFHQLKLL